MIDSPIVNNKSRKPDKSNNIDFKNIDFRYPTRPDVQILNNFNLNVTEGKTIALVGPSGCGKSTCIQLLQRFYDPEHGRIHVGLDEITTDISIEGLRSKLGIVSQEPVLFDKTIAENIAYGDNSRVVSMDEIMDAARIANVHDFIIQLPLVRESFLNWSFDFINIQNLYFYFCNILLHKGLRNSRWFNIAIFWWTEAENCNSSCHGAKSKGSSVRRGNIRVRFTQ